MKFAAELVVDVGLGEVLIERRCAFGLAFAEMLGEDELAKNGRSPEDPLTLVSCGLESIIFLRVDVVVQKIVASFEGAGKIEIEE